jgi:hypothetical protein
MELFARESLRRHAVLTERIRTEVAMACEKQLAVQHKLAPVDVSRVQEGLNGWLTTVLALRIRHIQFTENFVFLLE